ncbi:MAG TPA: hypothetical protein PKW80_12515, partial [Bacteroidales bacterium]|nr:hypothetical protein [Bacteroidales bacterium]
HIYNPLYARVRNACIFLQNPCTRAFATRAFLQNPEFFKLHIFEQEIIALSQAEPVSIVSTKVEPSPNRVFRFNNVFKYYMAQPRCAKFVTSH